MCPGHSGSPTQHFFWSGLAHLLSAMTWCSNPKVFLCAAMSDCCLVQTSVDDVMTPGRMELYLLRNASLASPSCLVYAGQGVPEGRQDSWCLVLWGEASTAGSDRTAGRVNESAEKGFRDMLIEAGLF